MHSIETKSSAAGQHHAQIIRENVGIAADFVKAHAATGIGATTGYLTGFVRGLFGSKTAGGETPVPNA